MITQSSRAVSSVHLTVHGNPWRCDCDLIFLIHFVKKSGGFRGHHDRLDTATIWDPSRIRMVDLNEYSVKCPSRLGCPDGFYKNYAGVLECTACTTETSDPGCASRQEGGCNMVCLECGPGGTRNLINCSNMENLSIPKTRETSILLTVYNEFIFQRRQQKLKFNPTEPHDDPHHSDPHLQVDVSDTGESLASDTSFDRGIPYCPIKVTL
ncbi:hypothetical protein Btru_046891 [Bulinus truncatus]|nr:hypothetical protein Btru_046891 [Bulinus truncatus]